MSAHTPGPWRVEEKPRPDGFLDIVNRNFSIAVVMGGLDDGPFDVGPVQQANARLIAAAPDLLEALKGLRALIIGECGASTYECFDGERADAAIAKAEVK